MQRVQTVGPDNRFLYLLLLLVMALPALGAAADQMQPSSPPIELTIQSGHTAEIHGLEYASNGKFFVSAGKDSTIKLWSPAGMLIRTIRTGFWVNYLALSQDNTTILAASRVGDVFLLTIEGRLVHKFPRLPMTEGFVSAVALSDDNSHIAIGTTRGLVLYQLQNTTEVKLPVEGGATELNSVLFTRDGHVIAGTLDGKLCFWSSEGKLHKTVTAHEYPVRTIALSPDGKTLASAGMTLLFTQVPKNIKPVTKLWDLEGNPLGQFTSQFTQCLRFSSDGETLASGGRADNRVNLYKKSGELLRSISVGTGEHQSPYLIALAPDGRTLVTADDNLDPPGLAIWSSDGAFDRSLRRLSGQMNNVVTSPDGNTIVTLSVDRLVRIWSITGRLVASLPGHKEYSTGLAYAPNGMYFASGGDEVILWSKFGQKLAELTGFRDSAGVLAFSPDSRYLFCGDGGGTVHIYDLQSKSVRRLKASENRVTALAIHPSGKYFATGSYREEVRIWDFDGELQGESHFLPNTKPPLSPTYSLVFSPDGERLVGATTNRERSLQIFDLKAQVVDVMPLANGYQGGAITFSKSGKWFAATANSTVVVWDWASRKVVSVLKGHTGTIDGLCFMPDEDHLVTAGSDSTTRVWRANGHSMALLAHGGDWIVYTPDGYFDASHYGGDLVSITRGLETFGIDQFALQRNRPDLILERMGIGSPDLIDHLRSRYQRRIERSGFHQTAPGLPLEAPEVHLLSTKLDGKFAQIEAELSSRTFPLQHYQAYVNNVPIFPGQGKPLSGLNARVQERIELGPGENKIEISAFNDQGAEALRAHWSTIYRPDPKGPKNDLYYIGFGVSHYRDPALNLQFAHKDVLDLGGAIERYSGAFRHVMVKTYIDDAVTRENVLKARELLKNAGVDDTVLVLVSGHGAYDLSKEATYYYGTYDINLKDLSKTAVSFDEIESLLRDIAPRRKLLLLDTCESGEMDDTTRTELTAKMRDAGLAARTSPAFQQVHAKEPKRVFLYERDRYIYNDLARRTGSIIFSASHAGEMSFESPKIQNGFFTHEVLAALASPQADLNHDGMISVDELEAFATLNVSLKTGGLQRPTVDRDNINQRFGFPLLH